ncbi:DNA-directed RNA polymerases I, II, and III subunit RPABC1 [Vairimorpha necatrix]|uniref:DNA-directed RNA polymerases I, II, and III subunit RPABC1 n=1 Tax=Vairimorpha necatrix TaxID=6039 RepID=A0AAX4JHJ4_9MICR
MSIEKKRKFWLCRNTLLEMISQRGYTSDQLPLPYPSFISLFPNCDKDVSSINFVCKNNQTLVAIHFIDEDKIGKSAIEKCIDYYKNMNITHLIIVINQKMSATSQNIVHISDLKIEIFKDEELLFNITKHVSVPKHRILSEEETRNVLKEKKMTIGEMPKILKKDPVCRFYGAESGEVIEITRKSRTAGESIYYKVVEDKVLK